MKIHLFISPFLFFFFISCKNDFKREEYIKEIYKTDLSISKLTFSSFNVLKEIANEDIDLFVKVPDTISNQLFGKTHDVISCRRLVKLKEVSNYLGEFSIVDNNIKSICLVTFKSTGSPLNYLYFKFQQKNDGVWDKYFTCFYYHSLDSLQINILNPKDKAFHPSLSEILKSDIFIIDSKGGRFGNVSN